MSKPPLSRLSKIEIEALLAAAGNVDPCMFEEDDSKEGETSSMTPSCPARRNCARC